MDDPIWNLILGVVAVVHMIRYAPAAIVLGAVAGMAGIGLGATLSGNPLHAFMGFALCLTWIAMCSNLFEMERKADYRPPEPVEPLIIGKTEIEAECEREEREAFARELDFIADRLERGWIDEARDELRKMLERMQGIDEAARTDARGMGLVRKPEAANG